MKTPRIAAVYEKNQYWADIEKHWRTDGTYEHGCCLPRWVHDFISVHPCCIPDADLGWSLLSPLKFVEHPSCNRPHWEQWHFPTQTDAITAAKWLARLGNVWVVDCTEDAMRYMKAHAA